VTTWTGQPIDVLWRQLQHLDEEHRSVEMACSDQSPFSSCMGRLAASLHGCHGDGVALGPLFFQFEDRPRGLLTRAIRHNLLSVSVQVNWRFVQRFSDWPFLMFKGCQASHHAYGDMCHRLWSAPLCCLDSNVSYRCRTVWRNADHMASDGGFVTHLASVQSTLKLTNMHLERLLARFKRATGSAAHPLIERVATSGILSQWLGTHMASGGRHPSAVTREGLIKDGVPIIAKRAAETDGRKSRANVRYMQERYQVIKEQRRLAGETIDRAEYNRTADSSFRIGQLLGKKYGPDKKMANNKL
jgi:hypothetical protein